MIRWIGVIVPWRWWKFEQIAMTEIKWFNYDFSVFLKFQCFVCLWCFAVFEGPDRYVGCWSHWPAGNREIYNHVVVICQHTWGRSKVRLLVTMKRKSHFCFAWHSVMNIFAWEKHSGAIILNPFLITIIARLKTVNKWVVFQLLMRKKWNHSSVHSLWLMWRRPDIPLQGYLIEAHFHHSTPSLFII